MKIKNSIAGLTLILNTLIFVACESTDLDLTQDPNFLSPSEANADFFLNAIQVDFGKVVNEFGEETAEVVRMKYMNGRNYQNAYEPTDFDIEWTDVYQQVLQDIDQMTVIAEEGELYTHVAIGQIIEAYTMIMLVDFFGDIPYSEALQGDELNFNPVLDGGASIYDDVLVLLDEAIANLALEEAALPGTDLFYNGDEANWERLANTIKMKIYLNVRLIDDSAITSFFNIVNNEPYIQTTDQDFEFQYGISQTNPDTRHQWYIDQYTPSGAGGHYMSNWLMDYMMGKDDARMLYYFYRQASEVPVDEQLITCSVEAPPQHYVIGDEVYCSLPEGYWGRDHGNDAGGPPDSQSRTAFGVYPAGGLYDQGLINDNPEAFAVINSVEMGGLGAGITPMLLASGVDFMIAEMQLMQGNNAEARAKILEGIQKSFTKVRSFGALDPAYDETDIFYEYEDEDGESLLSEEPLGGDALTLISYPTYLPPSESDESYLAQVGALFDEADDQGKMNLLAKELFVVLFGNGMEAYNFFRRTGEPNDIQPNIDPNPGPFIRSFVYPANAALRNSNFPQNKQVSTQVFWDTNPADFVF
ncbi:MAG: SusD/RagB family nutrient-binding outer membrane lipoprotein [Bacteroidota bacterium]